jgi:hypothetical protein
MTAALGMMAGLVLALGTISLARRWAPGTALRVYALGLVATAGVYVVLALAGRASARWVAIEVLGVGLYGAAAWLGLRHWLPALALGWAAHVGWDLALHLGGAGAVFTPAWYPWLCLGFDLPVALAVLAQGRGAAERRIQCPEPGPHPRRAA